jgi:flagella basal body P-ring formation protein FlgA
MKRLTRTITFAAALTFAGVLTAAEAIQPLGSVRDAVARFLQEQTTNLSGSPRIEVGALDPRLRLALCEQPLEAFFPASARTQGNVTVGVRCSGSSPWSIYVPARVQVYDRVIVAARPLSRGSVLKAGDLDIAELDVTSLAGGYFSESQQAVGMSLRRNVQLGTALGPGLVELPKVIRRGERVQIVARVHGMQVTMDGEALEDGAKGDRIRVRNRSSKRNVEGLVAGPGIVEVRF